MLVQEVSEEHDKSLNFLKQHFLSHAIKNFRGKGTSRNMNTRVGEGFQQEVAAQYKKTNGKNAEHQVRPHRLLYECSQLAFLDFSHGRK